MWHTTGIIQTSQAFCIYMDTLGLQLYMAHSPCFCLPLQVSLCLPFLLTWNPPSCDRIRPPRSQVACKLTPPLSQTFTRTLPFQIPRTPTAQCLTTTTSGTIRRLLSGTINMQNHITCLITNKNHTLYRSPLLGSEQRARGWFCLL